MIMIPSIDIKDGKCVRLTQGDFSKTSVYSETPQKVAQAFAEKGASALHVVDLDGAKNGQITQVDIIKSIKEVFPGIIQVGGGVRESKDIDRLLGLGAQRVVVGSCAVQNIPQTLEWLRQYGVEVIVLALDFKMVDDTPYLAVQGWQKGTEKNLWDVLDQYSEVSHVLCTDISKDGMQTGPNLKFYEEFMDRYPHLNVQASGGITTLDDIIRLKDLGVYGAIIGKAIYENKLSLEEVIRCSRSG